MNKQQLNALGVIPALDTETHDLTKSHAQVVTEKEVCRRALHRELSQQAYLINPMNGETQVGKHEIVEFAELLVLVGDFNKGKLPHSDDWFTIEDIDEKRYPMELFYQFIKKD